MVFDSLPELITTVQVLVSRIQWLIGGFFGLYLFYYIFSYFSQRKTVHLLEDIRDQLNELNKHLRNK